MIFSDSEIQKPEVMNDDERNELQPAKFLNTELAQKAKIMGGQMTSEQTPLHADR